MVDGPAPDRGDDEVHAEVEHQEEAGHRLQPRVRHVCELLAVNASTDQRLRSTPSTSQC